MISINITEEKNTPEEMAETLRHIANQIEQGYTSGYYPTWELKDKTDRQEKIEYIKKVIREWGVVNTAELELESSPVYNSMGKDHYMLVEGFYNDWVEVVEYVHEEETDSHNVSYEELEDCLIDEICIIIENYEADCIKTEKRISNG
jgi:hypothetical protein